MKALRKHIISFLLLFLLVHFVSAQPGDYSVTRILQFRINGKDAKPITVNSLDYKIKVDVVSGMNSQINTSQQLFDGGFSVTISEVYGSYTSVKIKIVHGNELMSLTSSEGVDSIPFTQGNFYIPREYAPLFQMRSPKDQKIINQDLSLFKIIPPDSLPHLKRVNCTSQIGGDFLMKSVYTHQTKTKIVLGQDSNKLFWLWKSIDNGSTWEKIFISGLEKTQNLNELSVIDFRYYLLGYDNKRKMNFVVNVNDEGIATTDSLLTIMQTYSLKFIDSNIGFALGFSPDGLSSFFRTLNGGKNWELMYSGMQINNASVFHFATANTGFIISSDMKALSFYKTIDGGRSWEKYLPFSKIFPSIKEDILPIDDLKYPFQSDIFSISDNCGIAQLQIGFEGAITKRITFFDGNRGAMVADNYILYTKDACKTWTYIPFDRRSNKNYYFWQGEVVDAEFLNKNTLTLYCMNAVYTVKLNE